jgi:hypothetical protein
VALFALACAGLQQHLVPIACAWLVVIALAPLLPGWSATAMPVGLGILFKLPSIAFAGGLLVPTLARHAPMGFSILALAPCFLFWPESVIAQYWVASAAAIFVTLDVSRLRVSAPGLAKLGDWSYALYLCHPSGVFARPQTRARRRIACRPTGSFRDRRLLRNSRCVALSPLKGCRGLLCRRKALATLVLGDVLRFYPGCAHFPLKGPTLQHGYDRFQICVALFERQITRRVRHDYRSGPRLRSRHVTSAARKAKVGSSHDLSSASHWP